MSSRKPQDPAALVEAVYVGAEARFVPHPPPGRIVQPGDTLLVTVEQLRDDPRLTAPQPAAVEHAQED